MADIFVPFDKLAKFIWLDGQIVSGKDATTHVLNHSMHGSGVFEGVRIYNGHIFLSRQHTQRLLDGATAYKYKVPFSADAIDRACEEVVIANQLTNGYLRPITYLGSEDIYVAGSRNTVHLAIIAFPLHSVLAGELKLMTATLRRASAKCLLVHTKSAPVFAASRLGKLEAEENGFDDTMFLDEAGFLADCSVANIFLVMADGRIHTPRADNILPGITQKVIFKLAALRGYEVVVRQIRPEELANATEAFVCGTAAEVTGVVQIDDQMFTPGKITTDLVDDYFDLVSKHPDEVDRILGISGGIGL